MMKKLLLALSALSCVSAAAIAQIHTDPNAPGSQRPTLLQSANGIPQVDITTPSPGGVSMNQFRQFDIKPQGVIINNGYQPSHTKLAGWVAANPWLAGGSASVIIHQVNSTNPSSLQGYLEIAGNKADFILANPAGITCAGCGFLNAAHVQLASGKPQLQNGQLSGFDIGSGRIQIDGAGMDARDTNYAELLARETRINAALWANHLRITMGGKADGTADGTAESKAEGKAEGKAASPHAPFYALDVSRLGGMVAGQIWLIGTEHGLGMRNDGKLFGAGEFILTADGHIQNRGHIEAPRVTLRTNTLDNLGSGTILGDQVAITGKRINNIGDSATPTNSANPADTANPANPGNPSQTNASPIIAAATSLAIGAEEIHNRNHALLYSGGTLHLGGALDDQLRATGPARLIHNASASIEALGDLHIASASFANTNESFATVTETVSGPSKQFYIQPEGAAQKILGSNFRWQGWSRAGLYRWNTHTANSQTSVLGKTPIPQISIEDCAGEGVQEVCTPTPETAYARTDPAWAYFNLSAPESEPAAPGLTKPTPLTLTQPTDPEPNPALDPDGSLRQRWLTQQADYARALAAFQQQQQAYDNAQAQYVQSQQAWRMQSDARMDALERAIANYNAGFGGAEIKAWTQFYVTHTELQSRVIASDPAKLSAGGTMTLEGGHVINDKSRITAGGPLVAKLNQLDNIDAIGEHIVQESGTSQHTQSRWRGGFKRYHQRDWGPVLGYEPADVVTSFTLPVTELISRAEAASNQTPNTTKDTATVTALTQFTERALAGTNRLFHRTDNESGPLIETNPRFVQYRQWLNADAMLSQLSAQPATTQKRLGDGYLEQQLLREQIAQLTGRRFLPGYSNDETQYAALMQSGVSIAQRWQLRPGIALTAQQVQQLTTDIVWLEEQHITLPGKDGQPATTTAVLVPRVYLLPRSGDLQSDGTLIAAERIDIELAESLNNSGTLAAGKQLTIAAGAVNNNGGTLAGEQVTATTTADINNIGGRVQAQSALNLEAGGDINIASTTQSSTKRTRQFSLTNSSRTNLDRIADITVTDSNGQLHLKAQRDLNLDATRLNNAGKGSTTLTAGRDLNLGTVATTSRTESVQRHNDANFLREASSKEVGTQIQAAGDISLAAGGKINARAATVTSQQGKLDVAAEGDIHIVAGTASSEFAQGSQITSSGLLSSRTVTKREAMTSHDVAQSVFSAEQVQVKAGGSATVQGSQLVSGTGTTLSAARDIVIESATAQQFASSSRQDKESGLLGGPGVSVSLTLGSRTTDAASQRASTTQIGSMVGTLDGNVDITAGKAYRQTASTVMSPSGPVAIDAQSINIQAGTDTAETNQQTRTKQTGITLAISNPIISAAQTLDQLKSAASSTKDARAQAMAASAAALTVANTAAAVQADPTHAGGVTASLTLGTSQSQSQSTQSIATAAPSNVAAAQDIRISAGGAKDANGASTSALSLTGSQIQAGGNIQLQTDGDLQLNAAANTATQRSTNSSKNAAIGAAATIGAKPSVGLTIAAGTGRGNADGDDVSWTPTQIQAGQQISTQSGGHTSIEGATLSAEQVTMQVGGNLTITSLQDTSRYQSQHKSISGSATIGPASSANVNLSKQNVDSNYASVNQQSGIQAGDGGFTVAVNDTTTLTGGAITSTEEAVQHNKNKFSTEQLNTTDIANRAHYQAKAVGISIGGGTSTSGNLVPSGTSAGVGNASGSASSTTQAAISDIAGNKQARTGDAPTGIAKIFDAATVEKDVGAQVVIMQTFTREAPKAVANYADSQAAALNKQRNQEIDSSKQAALEAELNKWKEGGAYRVALHAATGALAGGLEGAIGAGTVAAAAPALTDLQNTVVDKLKAAGVNETVAKGAAQVIATTAAAAVGAATTGGSAQGAAVGMGVDANNRQLHPIETQWIEKNAKRFAQQQGITEKEAEKRLGQQAFRQVQFGIEGLEDAQARNFLMTNTVGMLLPGDPMSPGQNVGYMFYATPAQKLDATMYLNAVLGSPDARSFYSQSQIKQPSLQQIVNAVQIDGAQRAITLNKTVLAAVAAGALLLSPAAAGVATELAAFSANPVGYCLKNPSGCGVATEVVICAMAGPACPANGMMPNVSARAVTMAEKEISGGAKTANVTLNGANGTAPLSQLVDGSGLAVHEENGGHLLLKHVAQTEAELVARLLAEPRIPSASTFLNRAEAESGVNTALNVNATQLSNWVSSGARGNLVLNAPFNGGLVLQRGMNVPTNGNGVTVILRGTGNGNWRIVTGYPTP